MRGIDRVNGRCLFPRVMEFKIRGHTIKDVNKKVDEGRAVDVIHKKFDKAFDKVPHSRLVSKVRSHGIQLSYKIGYNPGLM
eukprot:g31253.t1